MRLVTLLLMVILPLQAAALSCQRPSVERTFNEVIKLDAIHFAVVGRLTFDRRKMPKGGNNNAPKLTRIPARLVGKFMVPEGFKVPFDHPISLEVSCFGPWCGKVENGADVLAFVKRVNGKYSLAINPCGGHVFPNPKRKMMKQVLQCFRAGACK